MGVSRATIWNWVNPKSRHHRPDFPKPIKLSENITGWLSSEIEEYLNKLAAKREEWSFRSNTRAREESAGIIPLDKIKPPERTFRRPNKLRGKIMKNYSSRY